MTTVPIQASENPTRQGERGMALILVLSMLVILSILGAFALDTSTTEIGITNNFQGANESLLAADRAVQYAKGVVINEEPDVGIDLNTDNDLDGNSHAGNLATLVTGDGLNIDTGETNAIAYLADGNAPELHYSTSDAKKMLGVYYRVNVTGVGRNPNAKTRVESVFFALTNIQGSGQMGHGEMTGDGDVSW